VIGEWGVSTLINRALHLASASFPWLATIPSDVKIAEQFTEIAARLEAQDVATALEASQTMFVQFTDLLCNLIGEQLTAQLLGKVWLLPPGHNRART
jgi:hypothetical protein